MSLTASQFTPTQFATAEVESSERAQLATLKAKYEGA